MLSFRKILNFISCLALLLSLVSVSDFTCISTNNESQKTEIVDRKLSSKNTSIAKYNPSIKTYQGLVFNPFTIFNFKCLLIIHYFDFSLTVKSQKESILLLLKNQLLEQNLKAQINSSNYKK